MHTEKTLTYLEQSTTTIGNELRNFRKVSQESFKCQELPKETAARQRRREIAQAKKAANNPGTSQTVPSTPPLPPSPPKKKTLNLFTYKFHALGDYVRTIRMFGTTDSYSTQIVCFAILVDLSLNSMQGELSHRLVKRFYSRTNKINPSKHIAKQERRYTHLRRAREAAKANHHRKHAHHVGFSDSDPLPASTVDLHHHISDSTQYPHHLLSFVRNPPDDPSKKVLHPFCCKQQVSRTMLGIYT
jgi:hypothetical protein